MNFHDQLWLWGSIMVMINMDFDLAILDSLMGVPKAHDCSA